VTSGGDDRIIVEVNVTVTPGSDIVSVLTSGGDDRKTTEVDVTVIPSSEIVRVVPGDVIVVVMGSSGDE
jgi:hypothetical protein